MQRGSDNIVYNELNSGMWRDQSDRLVCNQHYVSTLITGILHIFHVIIINTDLQHMHVYMLMSVGVCDIKMCDVLRV